MGIKVVGMGLRRQKNDEDGLGRGMGSGRYS